MISVLLVDDQALVREGIASLLALSDQVTVVGSVGDGQQALAWLASHPHPDVILLDLRMPNLDGIGVLQALTNPAPAVLVLTTFDDHEALLAALKAGAKGYLLKDVSLETLVAGIEAVATGQRFIPSAVTESLAQRLGEPADDSWRGVTFSPKEVEILRLLAAGYANREIAQALFKSEGTVKNQVSVILSKLNVRDRAQAVLKAMAQGVI